MTLQELKEKCLNKKSQFRKGYMREVYFLIAAFIVCWSMIIILIGFSLYITLTLLSFWRLTS